MTSISHAASSSASLPSLGLGRFRFGADSKAVRAGLGVAIAAVLAGDVYAVLRSPVSERSSAGSSAAAAVAESGDHASGTTAAGSGFVATNPFSEAAYGAELAGRLAVPAVSTASAGPAAAPAPAPAGAGTGATAPALSAPVAAPSLAPVMTPNVGAPAVNPPAGPSTPSGDAPAGPAPSEPTLVQQVVSTVAEVPVVGGTVAPVVEQVVEAAPVPVSAIESEVAPVAEVVPAPVGSGLPL